MEEIQISSSRSVRSLKVFNKWMRSSVCGGLIYFLRHKKLTEIKIIPILYIPFIFSPHLLLIQYFLSNRYISITRLICKIYYIGMVVSIFKNKKEMENKYMMKEQFGIMIIAMFGIVALTYYVALAMYHEKGHVDAIRRTASKLGYEVKFIKVSFRKIHSLKELKKIFSMITDSDFYSYISARREEKEIQEIIRENAMAGIINEKKMHRVVMSLFVCAFISLQIFGINELYKAFLAFELVATLAFYGLSVYLRKKSSDMDYYKDPTTFTYKY